MAAWFFNEYAAHADATAANPCASADSSRYANTFGPADGYGDTSPVGSFANHAVGLDDMIGNVWEWAEDCYTHEWLRPERRRLLDKRHQGRLLLQHAVGKTMFGALLLEGTGVQPAALMLTPPNINAINREFEVFACVNPPESGKSALLPFFSRCQSPILWAHNV